jgi:hypothetical protein
MTVWLLLVTTPYGEAFPDVYADQQTCEADLKYLKRDMAHDGIHDHATWRCVAAEVKTKTVETGLREEGIR